MKQYLDLLQRVLKNGERMSNRTGIDSIRISGEMLRFDLRESFPAVTTKRLAFKQVKGELIGFIRGYDNAAAFRNLGCTVWDQNANENESWLANESRKGLDDLGRIYGQQWRGWYHDTCGRIDQLANAVNDVQFNADSRRIIVTAWNPADLKHMALPPCHMMFQLLPNRTTKTLSMCMYQRSCDMFLGIPFNIASYALLLEIIAKATGYIAAELTMFLADVHIYVNHIDQVNEQLSRDIREAPKLVIAPEFMERSGDAMTKIVKCVPEDFSLEGYSPHDAIKGAMAV